MMRDQPAPLALLPPSTIPLELARSSQQDGKLLNNYMRSLPKAKQIEIMYMYFLMSLKVYKVEQTTCILSLTNSLRIS